MWHKSLVSAARDLLFFSGVGLTTYGLHLWWVPAGFIYAGIMLTGVSVFGMWLGRANK